MIAIINYSCKTITNNIFYLNLTGFFDRAKFGF